MIYDPYFLNPAIQRPISTAFTLSSREELHDGHVLSTAKLGPYFQHVSCNDKPSLLMEPDAGSIFFGDQGHNGVMPEITGRLDQGFEQSFADSFPLVLSMDIHRILHRRQIALVVPKNAQGSPSQNNPILLCHKDGIWIPVFLEPQKGFLIGSGDLGQIVHRVEDAFV